MARAKQAAPNGRGGQARRSGKAPHSKKTPNKKRSLALFILALLTVLVLGALGAMRFNAATVHLRYADLYLPDLPASFEGATLLFASDIDIKNSADGVRATRLFRRLSALEPDALLLGGDYCADTLLETLNGGGGKEISAAERAFIATLADFPAPLGKYAVAGENDAAAALQAPLAEAGITLLQDLCLPLERGGERIYLAGLSDASAAATPFTRLGDYFDGDECVLVLAHNPSSYVGVRVSEARDGGAWADAMFSGHTLGGQIRLFGRNLRQMDANETRVLHGWSYADDLPLLVSSGVGCEDVNLRLGSSAEVWMITLHRQLREAPQLPELPAASEIVSRETLLLGYSTACFT